MRVTLALSAQARHTQEWPIDLPAGATVAQALQAVAWQYACSLDIAANLHTSVWGRTAPLDQILREGDRIELTRGLRVDPKVARRERFQKQGQRTAGLFARRKRP
ncbi:MAG: RnfH family protein [Alphaproteobacteria bacterium]|nr:RnfH family protein [Alphaproteobacteria bacterium]